MENDNLPNKNFKKISSKSQQIEYKSNFQIIPFVFLLLFVQLCLGALLYLFFNNECKSIRQDYVHKDDFHEYFVRYIKFDKKNGRKSWEEVLYDPVHSRIKRTPRRSQGSSRTRASSRIRGAISPAGRQPIGRPSSESIPSEGIPPNKLPPPPRFGADSEGIPPNKLPSPPRFGADSEGIPPPPGRPAPVSSISPPTGPRGPSQGPRGPNQKRNSPNGIGMPGDLEAKKSPEIGLPGPIGERGLPGKINKLEDGKPVVEPSRKSGAKGNSRKNDASGATGGGGAGGADCGSKLPDPEGPIESGGGGGSKNLPETRDPEGESRGQEIKDEDGKNRSSTTPIALFGLLGQ